MGCIQDMNLRKRVPSSPSVYLFAKLQSHARTAKASHKLNSAPQGVRRAFSGPLGSGVGFTGDNQRNARAISHAKTAKDSHKTTSVRYVRAVGWSDSRICQSQVAGTSWGVEIWKGVAKSPTHRRAGLFVDTRWDTRRRVALQLSPWPFVGTLSRYSRAYWY